MTVQSVLCNKRTDDQHIFFLSYSGKAQRFGAQRLLRMLNSDTFITATRTII